MNKKLDKSDYVSFETAKALKDAGFEQSTKCGYAKDGTFLEYQADYAAPHLWTAMKWLRDRHYINVKPIYNQDLRGSWECSLENLTPTYVTLDLEWEVLSFVCPTQINFESACDQGIKFACEWLRYQGRLQAADTAERR